MFISTEGVSDAIIHEYFHILSILRYYGLTLKTTSQMVNRQLTDTEAYKH